MTTWEHTSGSVASDDDSDEDYASSSLSSCPSDNESTPAAAGMNGKPDAAATARRSPYTVSSSARQAANAESPAPSSAPLSSALSSPDTESTLSSSTSATLSSGVVAASRQNAAPRATAAPTTPAPAKRKYTRRKPLGTPKQSDTPASLNGAADTPGASTPLPMSDGSGVVVSRMKSSTAQDVPRPDAVVELEKILFYELVAPSASMSSPTAMDVDQPAAEAVPTVSTTDGAAATDSAAKPTQAPTERFYIKFKNRSYLHCEWVDRDWIESHDKRGKQRLKHFMDRTIHDFAYSLLTVDRPFNDAYTKIDRILAESEAPDPFTRELTHWYLVKWCALPYDTVTWESHSTLFHYCDEAEEKVEEYTRWNTLPHLRIPDYFTRYWPVGRRPQPQTWKKMDASPVYKDGNTLRPYQLEGVNWLTYCWYHRQSSIIADEMGLGKTVQSITFLKELYDTGVRGPFLIVAPLSTIPHWERTVLGWTDLNPVVFHGSAAARSIIQNYELYYRCPKTHRKLHVSHPVGNGHMEHKFDVMITTYEMALSAATFLKTVVGVWRVMIVDEAHRLKSKTSKVTEVLNSYAMEHRVLLTGTPLQNNLDELWAILNFLDPAAFPTETEKQFLTEYDIRSAADVQRLQAVLKPLMLRRLKEDVEKSIPVKEETIVEVELTSTQRAYYRAILERNFQFLKQGTGKKANMPNLINAMMELRKCCIHPYLITGAEEKIVQDHQPQTSDEFLDCMIQASGKLVLLDKLLPKLKQGGHRVLIFSQMTRCLDILSDYLRGKGYLHERIDGAVRGDARQAAIDRFSEPDSEVFVFLLCTRAGGVGINLTAADTCVIYDSDWNPQNDLQAQARCHRIGQKKNVQIYRLITRNTYEKTMFDKAGMKLGLDRAVLSRMDFDAENATATATSASQLSKAEIEELLKKGAYAALDVADGEEDESKKFCEEDIDAILARRTQTIRHTGDSQTQQAEGSLFSKATFALPSNGAENVALDDPEFWNKWAKRANVDPAAVVEEPSVMEKLIVSGPRKRRVRRTAEGGDADAQLDDDDQHTHDEDESGTKGGKHYRPGGFSYASSGNAWTIADRQRIERGIMSYGFGGWEKKAETMAFRRSVNEIKAAEIRLLRWCMDAMRREKGYADKAAMDEVVRTAKQSASIREEHRMFEDVETILARVKWEVPDGEALQKMVDGGCKDCFVVNPTPNTDEPFPGATPEEIQLHRTFMDQDCPASYITSLAKKPRNMLLRVQNMDFIRQYIADLDPHAVAMTPVAVKTDEAAVAAEGDAEGKSEKVQAKYDPLIRAAISRVQFPQVYFLNFGESTAIAPGWSLEQDRDLMIGTIKHGYQNYEKMRTDPQLIFHEQHWTTPELHAAAAVGTEEASFPVFPSVSDIGTRIRRLLSFMQRDVRSGTRRLLEGAPPLTLTSEDHRWTRKERTDYARVISYWGLPEEVRMRMPQKEAQQKKYRITSSKVKNGLVTASVRDWSAFKQLAGLENKADHAMDVFAEYLVPALEKLVQQDEQKLIASGAGGAHDSANNSDYGDRESTGSGQNYPSNNSNNNNKGTTIKISLKGTGKGSSGPQPLDVFGNPIDFMVDGILPERAKRLLRRIALFTTLRGTVLHDAYLDLKLTAMRRSPGLPDWWQPNVHDRALLYGVAKHGFFADRQNLILFDPDLPFVRDVVEPKAADVGPLATKLNPYLNPAGDNTDEMAVDVPSTGTPVPGEADATATEAEEKPTPSNSAAAAVPSNLEELFGWPRDIIRQRRVEIIIDTVLRPSERIIAQVRSLRKRSGAVKRDEALKRSLEQSDGDQDDDDDREMREATRNDEGLAADLRQHSSDSDADQFTPASVRRQVKRLRGTIRLLKRYAKSPALRTLVDNFSPEDSDDTLEHALHIVPNSSTPSGAPIFTDAEEQSFYMDMEKIRASSTDPDRLDAASKHKMKQLVARRRIMAEMRTSVGGLQQVQQ